MMWRYRKIHSSLPNKESGLQKGREYKNEYGSDLTVRKQLQLRTQNTRITPHTQKDRKKGQNK
jgi:hypothetical protein